MHHLLLLLFVLGDYDCQVRRRWGGADVRLKGLLGEDVERRLGVGSLFVEAGALYIYYIYINVTFI
jgi:hypothetical protein